MNNDPVSDPIAAWLDCVNHHLQESKPGHLLHRGQPGADVLGAALFEVACAFSVRYDVMDAYHGRGSAIDRSAYEDRAFHALDDRLRLKEVGTASRLCDLQDDVEVAMYTIWRHQYALAIDHNWPGLTKTERGELAEELFHKDWTTRKHLTLWDPAKGGVSTYLRQTLRTHSLTVDIAEAVGLQRFLRRKRKIHIRPSDNIASIADRCSPTQDLGFDEVEARADLRRILRGNTVPEPIRDWSQGATDSEIARATGVTSARVRRDRETWLAEQRRKL